MTDIGVAGTIGVKICADELSVNKWLQENEDTEVIDIKFSSTTEDTDLLIIYRKDS